MGNSVSRRSLVKGAAVAGALAACGGLIVPSIPLAHAEDEGDGMPQEGQAGQEVQSAPADPSRQYGFWINTANCVACFDCVEACQKANKTPWDKDRLAFHVIEDGAGQKRTMLVQCQHCTDPSCATVCPAHAIVKGDGGIVRVDKDRCIGCKYCYQACPFGVPNYLSSGMDKCDYCQGAGVELGQPTNCARACTHDAMHCGPVEDLLALSGGAGKTIDCSTGPNTLFS